MKRNITATLTVFAVTSGVWLATIVYGAAPPGDSNTTSKGDKQTAEVKDEKLPTLKEARDRARLLHETIHATLQIVHHQYYREDEGLLIPARTLEAVFKELARSQNVQLRWLAVNAQAMNVDHEPRDAFEKNAVKVLTSGENECEAVEDGVYRHVGAITLSSECLKCHLPNRTSTKDRAAGLLIAIPIRSNVGNR